jgi:hypothetical protein
MANERPPVARRLFFDEKMPTYTSGDKPLLRTKQIIKPTPLESIKEEEGECQTQPLKRP